MFTNFYFVLCTLVSITFLNSGKVKRRFKTKQCFNRAKVSDNLNKTYLAPSERVLWYP